MLGPSSLFPLMVLDTVPPMPHRHFLWGFSFSCSHALFLGDAALASVNTYPKVVWEAPQT